MPWIQSSIQLQDRTAHLLIDNRFSCAAPVRELPCLNWVGVWMLHRAPEGTYIAQAEEGESLALERDLIRTAGEVADGWAVYCIRLLSRGIVEYYFYTRDNATLSRLVPLMMKKHSGYRIEHEAKDDGSWSEYEKYLLASAETRA